MVRLTLSLFGLSFFLALPFGVIAYLHSSRDFSIALVIAVFFILICLLSFADYLFLNAVSGKRQKPERLVELIKDSRYRTRIKVWPEFWMAANPLFSQPPVLVQGLFGQVKLVLNLKDWKELSEEQLIQYCLLVQKQKPARIKLGLATIQAWIGFQAGMIEQSPKWSLLSGLKYSVFIFFKKVLISEAQKKTGSK